MVLSRGGINFFSKNFHSSSVLMEFLVKYIDSNIRNVDSQSLMNFYKEENLFSISKIGNYTNMFVNNSLLEDAEESQINRILINSKTIERTSQNLISAHLLQFQVLFELSFFVTKFINLINNIDYIFTYNQLYIYLLLTYST